jgi:hypothetical protein
LSAFGNVLSVIFSQGRLVQELGREGILPCSRFWASNKPFNAPLAGLFEHWLVSVIIMLGPPPGDAYNFSKLEISHKSDCAYSWYRSSKRDFLPTRDSECLCCARPRLALPT